ncbi:MAG: hypothetical protein PHV68_06345 [Candidatus Gastranaerophilales bacterium]|nr:hypothetical protein [Candidatus Gastranaerophilales bacterium]
MDKNNNLIIKKILKEKIWGVVRTDCKERALDIAHAFVNGGIKAIEITVDFPEAPQVIAEISKIKDISVAAGSIITTNQAEKAIHAGAELLVSPIMEMSIVKLCKGAGLPHISTAATPTEAYNAWKLGVKLVKFFPIHVLGGTEIIRDILKAMPFLPLMPTGGVQPDTFVEYLKVGSQAVGMGKCFYENEENVNVITQKVKETIALKEAYLNNN